MNRSWENDRGLDVLSRRSSDRRETFLQSLVQAILAPFPNTRSLSAKAIASIFAVGVLRNVTYLFLGTLSFTQPYQASKETNGYIFLSFKATPPLPHRIGKETRPQGRVPWNLRGLASLFLSAFAQIQSPVSFMQTGNNFHNEKKAKGEGRRRKFSFSFPRGDDIIY